MIHRHRQSGTVLYVLWKLIQVRIAEERCSHVASPHSSSNKCDIVLISCDMIPCLRAYGFQRSIYSIYLGVHWDEANHQWSKNTHILCLSKSSWLKCGWVKRMKVSKTIWKQLIYKLTMRRITTHCELVDQLFSNSYRYKKGLKWLIYVL